MKRKIAILSIVAIALSLMAYGTVAYFSTEDTAHNVITTGSVKIDLHDLTEVKDSTGETSYVDFMTNYPDGAPVMPATEISKIVKVENTGTGSAWVRVKIEQSVEKGQDYDYSGDEELTCEFVNIAFDTENWTEKDGYWYYTKVLPAGQTTPELFKTVQFAPEMGNAYQNTVFKIDVYAEAVQSANNGATWDTVVSWTE